MKNYIVTGGLGHLGSHVVDELIERGDSVLIVDNLLTGKLENKNPKAELLNCSVLDIGENKIISSRKWDGVFHLAASSNVRESNENPPQAQISGANLTLVMLNLCKEQKIPKFIFTSSAIVKFNPEIPYSIEKDASERYCLFYNKYFNLDVTIIRIYNVYGSPRHDVINGHVIPSFIEQKKNDIIKISGDGSQLRDFIYYTDVIAAILESENTKGITEIGTCKGYSVLEVAQKFNCKIEFISRPKAEADIYVCKKSDYETKVSFEDGMKLVLVSL